jgi:hypothetical protein
MLAMNLVAIVIGAASDFALMHRSNKTPGNSVWQAFWYVCRAYLAPVQWIGGLGPGTIFAASLIEAVALSVIVLLFLRSKNVCLKQ